MMNELKRVIIKSLSPCPITIIFGEHAITIQDRNQETATFYSVTIKPEKTVSLICKYCDCHKLDCSCSEFARNL